MAEVGGAGHLHSLVKGRALQINKAHDWTVSRMTQAVNLYKDAMAF